MNVYSKIDKKDSNDLQKTTTALKEAFQEERYVWSIRVYYKPRLVVLTRCKYYRKNVFPHYYSLMLRAYDSSPYCFSFS